MSNSANPFTPNQQSMLQGSRRGARPGSVPLGNASGSGVGADLVRSVGLQVAPTISGSNSQYSWASGASFNLRYWPEAVNSSIEKVPAARKGAKLAPIAGESSKCNQCKGRNDHSNTCAFGCITLGQIPTGACAECIAMGTSNRYDRTLFTSLREELGIVKGLEQQVELAVKHNYTLPEIGLLSQVQGIRERLSTLIATYSPDMAPEDATANDTPRKRKRAASDEVAIGGRMSHNFAAFGYRHDTRTGPTPVRTDSGFMSYNNSLSDLIPLDHDVVVIRSIVTDTRPEELSIHYNSLDPDVIQQMSFQGQYYEDTRVWGVTQNVHEKLRDIIEQIANTYVGAAIISSPSTIHVESTIITAGHSERAVLFTLQRLPEAKYSIGGDEDVEMG
ncbi:hypothetical protein TREMEDRAFT_62403 [Tremella mesenterica DSM 1558]|uniref:uncharacterized protein n=1 Tax=Tremella mesenterica (strain ATCC 24925 / CBS 8224 / DSM 1558 / NBRC 9311 / NRRL Y-6157 / RJB 2259-6 / UBC 559-6) TaxID=578456 RepID=UPI0003F49551|nr:uncharacterized protein TREMEDRAFT_62403 [Tremella mesenterica DSM 1558]EIW69542.1 hypothetical protein TREMEDRAFT_62403 [Tremella mesenterica DSM 1558]